MRVKLSWDEVVTTHRELTVSAEWLADKLGIEDWYKMTRDQLQVAIDQVYGNGNRIEELLRELRGNIMTEDGPPDIDLDEIEWQVQK